MVYIPITKEVYMPKCKECKKNFPGSVYIEGVRKTLHKRSHCLDCVPMGDRSKGLHLHYKTKPINVGEKYGMLTILKEVGKPQTKYRDTNRYFLCKCECGNEKIVRQSLLKNGRTKSCGCLNKSIVVDNDKSKMCSGCSQFLVCDNFSTFNLSRDNKVFEYRRSRCKTCLKKYNQDRRSTSPEIKLSEILNRCKTKNFDCDLDVQFIENAWDHPCFYCGGERPTNGFDRVDNSRGYLKDNSVPCCKVCNYMKKTMDVDDFIGHALKIAQNAKG